MTTDPKDAEIARLMAERRMIVSHATMGQTDGEGLSVNAISVKITALRNELYQDGAARAEKAEAERDAALAQVATAITGNKSGTICRDCRGVGMIHCSDPFNCGGMQPYTVEELIAALSRRDAQMRAEGAQGRAAGGSSIVR